MKKITAILLTIAMMIGLLAGCGSKSDEGGESGSQGKKSGDTEITMWTFLDLASDNGRAQVLKKLIENFEKDNPGITVKVETQDWSTLASKIFAAAESGNCPDVFMVNTANVGEAISRGICEPLENLFYDDWTDEMKADVENTIWEQGFDGTNHYEVPLFYGGFGVMYRKDLFKKYEINPEDIVTWDDLIKAAGTLTYMDDNGQKIWGYGIGYSLDVTDPHGVLPAALFGQEGGMFTDDGKPNNWTGEAAKKALQIELDMVNKYKVTPESAASITSEDVYTDFQAGNYAMIAGGTIRIPTVQGSCTFKPEDLGFLPLPGIDANTMGLSYAAGWNTAVWSGSPNKEAAGKFLEYICSAEADELWVTEAQQIPLHVSTLEKCADFLEEPTNAWIIQAKDILDNRAYVQSIDYTVTGFAEDLQNAFQLSYVDGKSAEEALSNVANAFEERNLGR